MDSQERTNDLAAWLRRGLKNETSASELTKLGDVSSTFVGPPDFAADCDDYTAAAFEVTFNGRNYYVTVEDITVTD